MVLQAVQVGTGPFTALVITLKGRGWSDNVEVRCAPCLIYGQETEEEQWMDGEEDNLGRMNDGKRR